MQLILDADNINIQRNMSTVEQEPLNEKFLGDKVITHLADDITTGNKENIQKQENIIVPIDDNVVDTGKEIAATDDVLTGNLNEEKLNQGSVHTEDIHTSEEVIEEKNITTNREEANILIHKNIINQVQENETKLEEKKNTDVTDTEIRIDDDTDAILINENVTVEATEIVKDINNEEIPTKEENKNNLDTEVDISELSTQQPNEDKELDLHKVVNIADVLTELDKENNIKISTVDTLPDKKLGKENDIEMDIVDIVPVNKLEKENDIEMDIVDIVPEKKLEKENDIEKDTVDALPDKKLEKQNDIEMDTVDIVEQKKLEKDIEMDTMDTVNGKEVEESIQTEISNTRLEGNTLQTENTEFECDHVNDIIEKSTAIEIDDEEEKTCERTDESCQEIQGKLEHLDKTEDTEIIEHIDKPIQEDSTAKKVLVEKSTSIEIDDEEEKTFEKTAESCQQVQEILDKSEDAEIIEDIDKSVEEDSTAKKVLVEKSTSIEIDDEEEKTFERTAESCQEAQEILDKTEDAEIIEDIDKSVEDSTTQKVLEEPAQPKRICGLSNNLDIFSDEDDVPDEESPKENVQTLTETEKQCINLDDDDDIVLIDEDSSLRKENSIEIADMNSATDKILPSLENINQPNDENNTSIDDKIVTDIIEKTVPSEAENKDTVAPTIVTSDIPEIETNKVAVGKLEETEKPKKPLLPKNFLDTCKKNLSDMTRNDLEEFCILKIVESIVDRSNLGEIKAHLKNLTRTMEECRKKCFMLAKQNKDLQVVLKSVQEEQKKGSDHITPLKITRSVGMQVVMIAEKLNINTRKKITNGLTSPVPVVPNNNTKQVRNPIQNARNQKEKALMNQQIPVPRLVPATPPAAKINQTNTNSGATKQVNNTALPNGMRNPPSVQKTAEKRARPQAVTVDLTDDEPPTKLQTVQRGPVNQPMRVLTTGPNLIPAQRFNQNMNSPRKVYIPISAPQGQNVRPGQTIMLKTLPGLGPRPRAQAQAQALITKAPQNSNQVRFGRGQVNRHPAPLPDAMKQYQPPNWKSLPPAPDLKLSKVENGIVISWKIDGYEEENHEEIASYQLYAYQETSSPPNTALWKKIGDVKALPLPMACTLTQFMAGYKYYFAVRAVDIRSRFGPFSLPGSILLLNKM